MIKNAIGRLPSAVPASVLRQVSAARFSWIAANDFRGGEWDTSQLKLQTRDNVVKRLGARASSIPVEQISFMLNMLNEQLKQGKTQAVENDLVSMLSDPQFNFKTYATRLAAVPACVTAQAVAKQELLDRPRHSAYEPNPEDAAVQFTVMHPPKGTAMRHFTEVLPASLRTPVSILDLLPDNAICVTNLPASPRAEDYRRLFIKFGDIDRCGIVEDINRILPASEPRDRQADVRGDHLQGPGRRPQGPENYGQIPHGQLCSSRQGTFHVSFDRL